MRDKPSGPDLLWQARRVVLDELLPHLPDDKRYDALMVAAAMAMAAREGQAGDASLRGACARLRDLFDEEQNVPAEHEALEAALQELLHRLSKEIRAGKRDGDAGVHAALVEITTHKLRESNPKHLTARGIS